MSDAEVIALVREAFRSVRRPPHFTRHEHCDECYEIDRRLQGQSLDSLMAEDVDYDRLYLVTPSGFRYWLPALVRLALDRRNNHLLSILLRCLTVPISKRDPPTHLPLTEGFNRAQTAAVLQFLEHVAADRRHMQGDDVQKRELQRGIRNWKHFLECFEDLE